MKVEETVNTWFNATQIKMIDASNTDNTLTTSFCAVAIAVMKLYCRSCGHLIDNNFRLPAMALVRVISEFFIKFLWCTKLWTDDEIRKRMARWEKTSAQKNLKLFNNLLGQKGVFSEKQLNALEYARDRADGNIRTNNQSGMPNVTGNGSLFEDVASVFGADVSGILYGQYSNAVHIPTSILGGFITNDNQNLLIRDDVDESSELLRSVCLNLTYMFLKYIYHRYDWDIGDIQKEYETFTGAKG